MHKKHRITIRVLKFIFWGKVLMKFNEEDIGSNLMYAITNGLYSRDVSAIREYFQNAYDPPALANEISINFDNNGLNCSIKDNGAGMDANDLRQALGVGIYTKKRQDSEGIFGIGIWSGIAVCDKVLIITKRKGSDKKLRIEINAKAIREDSINNVKLTDFLSERTGVVEYIDAKTETEKSYTIVRLENILEILRNIKDEKMAFNEVGISEYASKNLPVSLDPSFTYANEVADKFDKLYIRPVNLTVGGKKVFRHTGLKDYVREPVIQTFSANIPGENGESREIPIVKVWGSLNREYITLDEELRGIDFRHNGFKIEDWSSVRAIKGGTFHERWVGEIHVIKPELLRPTAGRNAFQPVPWRDDIDTKIGTWLSEMQRFNSFVSVGISGIKREINNLKSTDLTKSKKQEIIKKVIEKNLVADLKTLENKPEYTSLVKELKMEQEAVRKEFEAIKSEVEAQGADGQPSRPDIKKAIGSLPTNHKLSEQLKTLMESKHQKDMKIDPFITLKEQIEALTRDRYGSFNEAVNAIGVKLTLYPNSTHRAENDGDLKTFLKGLNKVFRNLFEHASEETNEWFRKSKNVEKLKDGYSALIAFISLIIDELTPID